MSSADVTQRPMKGFQMRSSSGASAQLNSAGSGKVSLTLGGRKPAPPTNLGKRPHSMLGDHDGDEETSTQTEIVQFGGPEPVQKRPNDAKFIEPQRNRNWQQEAKRKRQTSSLPGNEQSREGTGSTRDIVNGSSVQYGLVIAKPTAAAFEESGDDARDSNPTSDTQISTLPKTDDERAMDALLGKTSTSNAIIAPLTPPTTEDDAFRTSYHDAPPMASLEAYAAMPVEEFGAALLRGQGWKEGEAIGRQRHKSAMQKERIVARRPALLGIGAKESGMGVELGAWGKGAKPASGAGGRPRLQETSYNPVALRNRKTGELLTEEELKQKLEDQRTTDKSLKDSSHQRSSKKDPESDRDSSRSYRRDKERDRDYPSGGRDEHQSYKHGKRRDRDRRRDYDGEEGQDNGRRRDQEDYRSSGRERGRSVEDRDRRRQHERDDYSADYRERRDKERRRDDRKERDDFGVSRSKYRNNDRERSHDHDRR